MQRVAPNFGSTKLNLARTVPRSPGPGAIRKVDWTPAALKHLTKRNIILHADSAPGVRLDALCSQELRDQAQWTVGVAAACSREFPSAG